MVVVAESPYWPLAMNATVPPALFAVWVWIRMLTVVPGANTSVAFGSKIVSVGGTGALITETNNASEITAGVPENVVET